MSLTKNHGSAPVARERSCKVTKHGTVSTTQQIYKIHNKSKMWSLSFGLHVTRFTSLTANFSLFHCFIRYYLEPESLQRQIALANCGFTLIFGRAMWQIAVLVVLLLLCWSYVGLSLYILVLFPTLLLEHIGSPSLSPIIT